MKAIATKLKKGGKAIDGFIPEVTTTELIGHNGDDSGFCVLCGEVADGCDPDTRNRLCFNCGEAGVFGLEELALMGMIRIKDIAPPDRE